MSSRRAPSIRSVVSSTMLIPVAFLALALMGLSQVAGSRIADRVGAALLETATSQAEAELSGLLRQAERLAAYTAGLVVDGRLPVPLAESDGPWDAAVWEPALVEQLRAFPAASASLFARPDGSLVGATRDAAGVVLLRAQDGEMVERLPDLRGRAAGEPLQRYPFDPRTRPWYRLALESSGPAWTLPYTYVARGRPQPILGTSFVRHVRDAAGRTLGVLAIDVAFEDIERWLREAPLAGTGRLLIVDAEGRLVAASHRSAVDERGEQRRLPAAYAPLWSRGEASSLAIEVDGERMLASITPVSRAAGGWSVVAAVPESLVRAQVRPVQIGLAIAGLGTLVAVGIAAIWLSRRVSDPVQALQAHVRRVGEGDFDGALDLRAAREFEELSRDLNAMSAALRERLRLERTLGLARQVQQSLLPPPSHRRPGLELRGHNDPCDSAGGDYYDWIELPGRDAVLVAVGDVMGHGVAAALLMATARAALRCEARRSESLGAMLLRVSAVLLQGRAHHHFMTMFLLLVEPSKRRIRWANAGHEPGLLLLPGSDEVVELGGGDLPLGIDTGIVYFERTLENVPPGALVYLGTDGIRETMGPDDEAFGTQRLVDGLRARREAPLDEVAQGLVEAVARHRGAARMLDDVTFVLARTTGAVPPASADPTAPR